MVRGVRVRWRVGGISVMGRGRDSLCRSRVYCYVYRCVVRVQGMREVRIEVADIRSRFVRVVE